MGRDVRLLEQAGTYATARWLDREVTSLALGPRPRAAHVNIEVSKRERHLSTNWTITSRLKERIDGGATGQWDVEGREA